MAAMHHGVDHAGSSARFDPTLTRRGYCATRDRRATSYLSAEDVEEVGSGIRSEAPVDGITPWPSAGTPPRMASRQTN